MNEEEKLLEARTEDQFRLCQKYAAPRFSQFLNEAEIGTVKEFVKGRQDCNWAFFGGNEDNERCIFGVFPEWEEPDNESFPIAILKAQAGFNRELTHRDYLGTVLSLGLERSKVGDILVRDKTAYIFVMEDIADYIIFNLKKIANCGVKIKRVDKAEKLPEREYKFMNAVAASLRLDAVLASSLKLSRKEASMAVLSGKVSVNHKPITDVSFLLKEGDLMSVRGEGRIILEETGTQTRSGRIHILLKKCVR